MKIELPQATVLLTTRNRRADLGFALRSISKQTGATLETLVIDDGSTDGTSKMVRAEFPAVRLERREESLGCIVRRNEGARLAYGPIIFSMDDDAEFSAVDIISRTLMEFDHPRVGAVAIPFMNVKQSGHIFQQATSIPILQITDAYIGTAHAIRRDVFLSVGGYRKHLVHQGEEGDFCLRMLAAGYVVRLGRERPILHHESPRRDTQRMDFYGRRNDILFALHNVPASSLLTHLSGTLVNGVRAAVRSQNPARQIAGLAAGLWDGARRWKMERQPVSSEIYHLHRRLKKNGPLPLTEIEHLLPLGCVHS